MSEGQEVLAWGGGLSDDGNGENRRGGKLTSSENQGRGGAWATTKPPSIHGERGGTVGKKARVFSDIRRGRKRTC